MTASIESFSGPYRFLSNFYPSEIEYEGLVYPTVEHAFQAAKTVEHGARMYIARCQTPGDAKRAGRGLKLREGWDDIRIAVMLELLLQKFRPGSALAAQLAETGDAKLVEGNTWHDRFWGVCDGEGLNMLGILLMGVREANFDSLEMRIVDLTLAVLELTEEIYNAGS